MSHHALILSFLHKQSMATIATVDEIGNKPESALVAFAELDTLELIFESFLETRKYRNLMKNNRVALVMGWDAKTHITVRFGSDILTTLKMSLT